MSADILTYDMSNLTEGNAQVFVKKDWLSILDAQNGTYTGSQSVIDTSQLANSNKFMNYREGYLSIGMVLTASAVDASVAVIAPETAATSCDMAFGLKNWFGSIVHSMTLDMNGTTIIQQTPFCSLWNNFKLMTTLSFQDVLTNGAQMGFYPDDPLAWGFAPSIGDNGIGTFNNRNYIIDNGVSGAFSTGGKYGNAGFLARQRYIAFDVDASSGTSLATATGATISSLLTADSCKTIYKSYINKKTNAAAGVKACIQYSIMATIQLKHLHSFFQNIPLVKGLYLRMTLNLNQTSVTLALDANGVPTSCSVNAPLGGISPIMIASADTPSMCVTVAGSTQSTKYQNGLSVVSGGAAGSILVSLAVGNVPIVSGQTDFKAGFGSNITLNLPAYTFNPVFESAYLSNPIKTIVYEDIYQYQVTKVAKNSNFNNLITNGIANISSVLVIPFFSADATTGNKGLEPWQSPFDDCGGGNTSPLAILTNFNVVVAGQNMLYNTQKYTYQMFLEQVQGCNAVNGDLTDGLTSSLISQQGWEQKQCYYYVNTSRMLPVEEAVPKSVSLVGQNKSELELNLMVFISYKVSVSVDVLSGSRV